MHGGMGTWNMKVPMWQHHDVIIMVSIHAPRTCTMHQVCHQVIGASQPQACALGAPDCTTSQPLATAHANYTSNIHMHKNKHTPGRPHSDPSGSQPEASEWAHAAGGSSQASITHQISQGRVQQQAAVQGSCRPPHARL